MFISTKALDLGSLRLCARVPCQKVGPNVHQLLKGVMNHRGQEERVPFPLLIAKATEAWWHGAAWGHR